jgi:hypothetical protein
VTPFEIYLGSPVHNPLALLRLDQPPIDEDKEVVLPKNFAEAVFVSTRIFAQLAKTNNQFVRSETVTRLNEKGSKKTFSIGDKVKIPVPPTADQMHETGRRAKHITAWRGPCAVTERLSTTAYAVIDDSSQCRYERVISVLLPYRAQNPKGNASAQQFNEVYSTPFTEDEFIAVRDDPTGPFYIAEIMLVSPKSITVQYYGTTHVVLADAVFKPCWNDSLGNDIVLAATLPTPAEWQNRQFSEYSGEIDLKDIRTVLVARNLELTKAGKLRFRSLRALAPVHDQLFCFSR